MAPNLSGIEGADAARVAHLVELALDFAQAHLRPRRRAGVQGVPRQRLQRARPAFSPDFKVVKPIKPKASRDKSAETFLVGIGLKTAAGVPHATV
jgi:23S rRNA (uridine2552-2'-O)-methyltransferase